MRDKILNALSADPLLDDRVNAARMIGTYIKQNPNGAGVDVTPEYIKQLAFPDREAIQKAKDEEISIKFVEYVKGEVEKQRVEEIRRKNAMALATIYDKTKELKSDTDKITQKSGQIEHDLSLKHESLSARLEILKQENQFLLEKQLERIESGEKQVAKKLSEVFDDLDRKFPVLAEQTKTAVSEFESRLRAEKESERLAEMNKPKPVYEQVLIEETGQIIEVMREDGIS